MLKEGVNNKNPWFIVVIAVTISILVSLIVTLFHNGKCDSLFIVTLFFNIGMEIIPYCILMVIWNRVKVEDSINKKYGMIGAFVLLILNQAFWEMIHWISYYSPSHDTTFTISVFFLSSGAIGSIGYGIGWSLGNLVSKFKENK